jgi:hypothetical protein
LDERNVGKSFADAIHLFICKLNVRHVA